MSMQFGQAGLQSLYPPELLAKYQGMLSGRQGGHQAVPDRGGILGSVADWVDARPERSFMFGGVGDLARKWDQNQPGGYGDLAMASLDMVPGVDDLMAKGVLAASAAGPAWMAQRMWKGGVPSGGAYGKQRGIIGGEDGLANEFAPTPSGKFDVGQADIDRREMLFLAQNAERRGLPPEKVFDATGWWRGLDGKWRSEIDDSVAQFPLEHFGILRPRGEVTVNAVGDMPPGWRPGDAGEASAVQKLKPPAVAHPVLGSAYPHLKDMPTTFSGMKLNRNTRGQFDPQGNGYRGRIDINSMRADNSVPLHEIQHAVQRQENFGTGATPAFAQKALRHKEAELDEYRDMLKETPGYQRASQVYANIRDQLLLAMQEGRLPGDQYDEMMKELHQKLSEKYPSWKEAKTLPRVRIDQDPYDNYKRVAGEVEARNVQKRMNFDRDYRRMLAPWKTEDVPQAQQFVIRQDGTAEIPNIQMIGQRRAK